MDDYFAYEKLDVWKLAIGWSCEVVEFAENLNLKNKHFRLLEQLEAASTSVALNIAEGKGRYSQKEFIHFLYIARGSLYETVTLLDIFHRLNWINSSAHDELKEKSINIAKMLNGLINAIKSNN